MIFSHKGKNLLPEPACPRIHFFVHFFLRFSFIALILSLHPQLSRIFTIHHTTDPSCSNLVYEVFHLRFYAQISKPAF